MGICVPLQHHRRRLPYGERRGEERKRYIIKEKEWKLKEEINVGIKEVRK
jgi:hypothetical protein